MNTLKTYKLINIYIYYLLKKKNNFNQIYLKTFNFFYTKLFFFFVYFFYIHRNLKKKFKLSFIKKKFVKFKNTKITFLLLNYSLIFKFFLIHILKIFKNFKPNYIFLNSYYFFLFELNLLFIIKNNFIFLKNFFFNNFLYKFIISNFILKNFKILNTFSFILKNFFIFKFFYFSSLIYSNNNLTLFLPLTIPKNKKHFFTLLNYFLIKLNYTSLLNKIIFLTNSLCLKIFYNIKIFSLVPYIFFSFFILNTIYLLPSSGLYTVKQTKFSPFKLARSSYYFLFFSFFKFFFTINLLLYIKNTTLLFLIKVKRNNTFLNIIDNFKNILSGSSGILNVPQEKLSKKLIFFYNRFLLNHTLPAPWGRNTRTQNFFFNLTRIYSKLLHIKPLKFLINCYKPFFLFKIPFFYKNCNFRQKTRFKYTFFFSFVYSKAKFKLVKKLHYKLLKLPLDFYYFKVSGITYTAFGDTSFGSNFLKKSIPKNYKKFYTFNWCKNYYYSQIFLTSKFFFLKTSPYLKTKFYRYNRIKNAIHYIIDNPKLSILSITDNSNYPYGSLKKSKYTLKKKKRYYAKFF